MEELVEGLRQAGNILLLVELAQQALSEAQKSSFSPTGKMEFRDLQPVMDKLKAASESAMRTSFSRADIGNIYQRAEECLDISEQLVRHANEQWSEGVDLESIETAFVKLKSRMDLDLLTFIEYYAQMPLRAQNELIKQLSRSTNRNEDRKEEFNGGHSGRKEGFGFSVVECLAPVEAPGDPTTIFFTLLVDITDALRRLEMHRVNKSPRVVLHEARRFQVIKVILNMQGYRAPSDMEVRARNEHCAAFDTIFSTPAAGENPWANYCQWLESDKQLYWITGAKESGKTTLMKLIAHGPQHPPRESPVGSVPFLRNWANGKPLITATFLYNTPGKNVELTMEGMLRSLLLRILTNCPEAMEKLSPIKWKSICLFGDSYFVPGEENLSDLLIDALSALKDSHRVCIFVDGLDELDGGNGDVARLFRRIIDNTSAKLCVVSRLLPAYRDILGSGPHLETHHLTHRQVAMYVEEAMKANEGFLQFQKDNAGSATQLVESITTKAAGVFVWALAAANIMLDGFHHTDKISDLCNKLDGIPLDISKLYQSILNEMEPESLRELAQVLLIMGSCAEPPPAILLSFAVEKNPQFAIELPPRILLPQDAQNRIKEIRNRIGRISKNLIIFEKLEETPNTSWVGIYRALYAEEKFRQFIQQTSLKAFLQKSAGEDFDVHLQLCRAHLALHKVSEPRTKQLLRTYFHEPSSADKALIYCMRHASCVEPRHNSEMIDALDSIDITGHPQSRQPWWQVDSCVTKFICQLHNLNEFRVGGEMCGPSLLSLAVKCGVVEYVKAKMPANCLVPLEDVYSSNHPKDPWPLLLDALDNSFPNSRMTEVLLEGGADPNLELFGLRFSPTIWGNFLSHLFCAIEGSGVEAGRLEEYEKMVRLMIKHGASLSTESLERAVSNQHLRISIREDYLNDLVQVFQSDFEQIRTNPDAPLDLVTMVARGREAGARNEEARNKRQLGFHAG
ncbi:unnamed protein product [Clonostachys rhizophaga]|uniref:Nephrocystin 3-like N-terminal domain-containing protein n=1 Tax=Clonostachys rhizophaga TaxID=160324 RepID=A0A9N9V8G0_9HYPO|nr:unnamed protein product [Clonostachys rhizophaga]